MYRNILLSLILILTVFFFTLTVENDASAEEEYYSDLYGAIAFSPSTVAHGYSFDYFNRAAAERRAVTECEKHAGADDCKVVIWFQNGCGALAVGASGFGSGWGENVAVALFHAFASCVQVSDNCEIVRWVCTSNVEEAE